MLELNAHFSPISKA